LWDTKGSMNTTLTAIDGIRVGHAADQDALTGCTVILLPDDTVAGVDVRGGAPGTRETDLLDPTAMMQAVNAICLTGGSAFGLAAATGVMEWLRERGIGFLAGEVRVPIVPAAVIFDLAVGRSDRWPDAAMGYAACEAANGDPVIEGCVGAGTGAAVGKVLGLSQATKSGIGSAAFTLPDGTTIAALAVTNAFGDVRSDSTGQIIAGARRPDGAWLDTAALFRTQSLQVRGTGSNTTIAIVATDAQLSKAECSKLAQMAQDALARSIRPIHTPLDGDTVFAVATGRKPATHLAVLGSVASDVLAEAIERSVLHATSVAGLPAVRDLAGAA
jgi:L-aminopeptidase/D-esterase-like protein